MKKHCKSHKNVLYSNQINMGNGGIFVKLDDLKKLAAQFPPPRTPQEYEAAHAYMRSIGLDPAALYQELEMSDPYVQVHRDTSHSNEAVQLHSHVFYEVLCCRNSCGAEYLVGTERYRLQKGDIVFVPPGVSHRPLLPETMHEPYVRDVLWFSTDFVRLVGELLPRKERQVNQHSSLLRTRGTCWEPMGELLRSAVRETEEQSDGWQLAVMGYVMTFMTQLKRAFQDAHTQPLAAEKPELLDLAMGYVEANLGSRITLEELARQLYVSESTVSQIFRRKMGVSVYRYVTQRRLIAAKTFIGQGLPLEEVAERVGFGDYSSFYRAFRQEYGISPRQFRKVI